MRDPRYTGAEGYAQRRWPARLLRGVEDRMPGPLDELHHATLGAAQGADRRPVVRTHRTVGRADPPDDHDNGFGRLSTDHAEVTGSAASPTPKPACTRSRPTCRSRLPLRAHPGLRARRSSRVGRTL